MHIFKFIPQILIVLFLIFTSESVAEETYIQRTLKRASRESRTISAIVRDMPADLKEFEMDTSNSVVIPNMVDTVLGADGKIRKGVVNFYSTNIESWFETINFGGGKSNDTCIYLDLTRSGDYWTFNSDNFKDKNGVSLGGFFPIDDFDNPNNCKPEGKYLDSKKRPHNFHFTMEIHTQFVYHEGDNQVFEFTGDDDVWVFVNGKLAIDLGGIHPARSGSVNLDNKKNYLNLKDSEVYSLDMFFCERHTDASNFKVRTTIDIHNDLYIFHDSTFNGIGNNTFDIQEYSKTTDIIEEDCGFNIYDSLAGTVVPAHVDFVLSGPYFGNGSETITNGVHYGGITIHGDSAVTIDSMSIVELTPGEYTITFISKTDPDLVDSVKFIVGETINKTAVSSAWYKDKDGNGGIDAVTIKLSGETEVLPDSARFINPLNKSEVRMAYKDDMTLIGNNVISVSLQDEMSYNHLSGSTGFNSEDFGNLYGGPFLDKSFSINDSVAPLIQRGIYKYGIIDISSDDNSRFPDTLIVVFSENVDVADINANEITIASLFSNEELKKYSFDLTFIDDRGDDRNYYFEVKGINNVSAPFSGDSIRINTSEKVSDKNGVTQIVSDNRYGFLEVVAQGYILEVSAISPVNPTKEEIPEELKVDGITIETGITILADYHMIISDKSKMRADVKIFDMVANDVVNAINGKDIEVAIVDNENSTQVIIVWNGKNSAGRQVASGSYIAKLLLTDPQGEVLEYSLPLGVYQR